MKSPALDAFSFLVLTFSTALLFGVGLQEASSFERVFIHSELTHLRSGGEREWDEFPGHAHGSSLTIKFDASENKIAHTIGLRRIDVKEAWEVKLNGRRLARLFSDENDMEEAWEVEPGILKDGENELVIEATSDASDDIWIGNVWLDPRPRKVSLGGATLEFAASSSTGTPLPCRYTLIDSRGTMVAFALDQQDDLAFRSGVIYSATGLVKLQVPPGQYRITCGRGFEYSRDEWEVSISEGQELKHDFKIEDVVDTKNWVSCDPHVHTFEISRHGDATLLERMVTLAGEGLDIAVATDHNVFIDYQPYLSELKLDTHVQSIVGNEVTTRFGHFNIFPAAVTDTPPDHQTDSWQVLFDRIRAVPEFGFAILNHPRDVHSGFTPFAPENMIGATGRRLDGRELEANGVELINSAALRSDPMQVFNDWMTLVNRGHQLTAVGTSDSHEVSRKIVGQGRTYVAIPKEHAGPPTSALIASQLVKGRARVSMGLYAELMIEEQYSAGDTVKPESSTIEVRARVQGPSWAPLSKVELYQNGILIKSWNANDAQASANGLKGEYLVQLDVPTFDCQYVVVAHGDGNVGLSWPIAKPYQPTNKTWNPYLWGSSGIVRLDADGDGRWESARELASQIVTKADRDPTRLVSLLADYDRPTALFAFELWEEQGNDLRNERLVKELDEDVPEIRKAWFDYQSSVRESLTAKAAF